MTGERNLNAIDRYAHDLVEELMPGAQALVSPMDSRNETNGTYLVMMPDNQLGLVKFAIPPDILKPTRPHDEELDPHDLYARTSAALTREARTIGTLKTGIREKAERFVEQGHYGFVERPGATESEEPMHYRVHPPSIWVPDLYAGDERGFIREWMSGQYVTSIDDLVSREARVWARDVATISELFGYSGFDALEMEGEHPVIDGRSIKTTFVRHHSPYTGTMVLSPTDYSSIVPVTDPTFRERQKADFRQALWLIMLAEQNENARANQSE